MPKTSLAAIVAHCDKILRTRDIGDYDGAANGLQVENRGTVSRIAAAVDASHATVKLAIAARADLLIVHHGLFWSPAHPWTGKKYELLRRLLDNNLAVYSSHLPLDAHPRLGNNAQLCAALGLKNLRPFFLTHGQPIGFKTRRTISRAELTRRLARATGAKPRIIPGRHGDLPGHWRGDRRCGRRIETGGQRRRGHVHYRRGTALDVCVGGGTRHQRSLRRPLCDGDVWRQGAGVAVFQKSFTCRGRSLIIPRGCEIQAWAPVQLDRGSPR